jgi:Bacterial Ig domain
MNTFRLGPPSVFRLGTEKRLRIRCPKLLLSLLLLALTAPFGRAQLSVTDGLVLWLQADQGLATNESGQVTFWADTSGFDNSATPVTADESPLWVADTLNHQPVVRFDGVDDYLQIPNGASLQPQSGDWTVVFVGKRAGTSQGDFPQVIGSRPWTAGLDKGWAVAFGADGRMGSHYADGATGHDVPAIRSVSAFSATDFQIWQVDENRTAGRTVFYLNGDGDASVVSGMPTGPIDQTDDVYIGREIGGSNNRRAQMDVAEILVYARALDKTDRDALTTYLSDKYGFGFTPNVAPTVSLTSPMDGATIAAPADLDVSADPMDSDGTIARVDFYQDNQLLGTASAPPYTLPLRVLTPGTLTFTAVATDDRGATASSAAATVTLTGGGTPTLDVTDGLQLWLNAGEGVSTNDDGTINFWADLSGNDNAAIQGNAPEAPLLVDAEANSRPVARFDGVDDFLEVANSPTLQPQSGDWTVFFVAKRLGASQGDFPEVIGSRPWTAGLDKGWAVSFSSSGLVGSHLADGANGHDVPATLSTSPLSTGAFQVWQVEENRTGSQTAFYLNGNLDRALATSMPSGAVDQTDNVYLGREIGGADNRRANMDLAEVLVYNQVLNGTDRNSVTAYLGEKYGASAITSRNEAPTVSITSPADGENFVVPAIVTLSAMAMDNDGSVASVQFFRGSVLLGTLTDEPYSLSVSNGTGGTVTYSAVAFDNLGASTRSASVTITNIAVGAPVPAPIDPAYGVISVVDYEDAFTVGTASRPDGLYNDNSGGAYAIENNHGNPAVTWTPINNFSFNSGEGTTCCGYPGNTGNDGAAAGLAQSGGGDFSIGYGLRDSYVVQVDAVLPGDRLDITSLPAAGGGIFAANSLSVFFRLDAAGTIGLFNGSAETSTGLSTGVADSEWHRFAVHFDRANNFLGIYVDNVLKTNLDLTTFASGAYLDYENGAVGLGGARGVFWADNFQVGAPGRLLRSLDFKDTFTVGSAPRTDGLYNDNSGGAYNLESDPGRTWMPFNSFSFNSGEGTTCCGYPGNTGSTGAATGLAQSGGGDFSFEYGLHDDYVVEVDAILPGDRFDITSLPSAGGGIFAADSLSVFLRRDGSANPGIGIFTPSAGESNGGDTGITDNEWHRYAVHFDQVHQRLGVYVDRVLKANLDLTTFAGGAYQNYSNGAVGAGGAGGVFWADNFTVGPAELELPVTALAPLTIAREGDGVTISWSGPGVLQETDDLTPPAAWNDLLDAQSPYPVSPADGLKFYRLRAP